MTVLLAAALVAAQATSPLDGVLADKAVSGAVVGVCVTRMDGSVVYERGGDRLLIPASCQKVYTVARCLQALGAGYRPVTRVWKTEYGAYVDAPGDPGLTAAQVREVGKSLALPKGASVRVRAAYSPGIGPGWEWDDLPYSYAAPVAAFSVDRCTLVVEAEAGKVVPLDASLQISVRRGSAKGATKVQYDPTRSAMTVSGALPRARTELEQLAQPNPAAYAARLLGGSYESTSEPPPSRPPDFEIEGAPLWALLKECAEESDNPLAEHFLFLGTGAQTYDQAASAMLEFLVGTVRVGPGSVVPVDGSGLSRRNRSSARALCRLFEWAGEAGMLPELEEAMAACGEGTLKKRLAGSSFVGKTGTMRGIVGLCGTLTDASGTKLAMTFLVNGSSGPASQIRGVQDKFVRALESGSLGGGNVAQMASLEGSWPAGRRRND